jgi:thioesterase domain-containing protein
VHTADGTVYSYRALAKLMQDTHQVYGVQARGLVDQSVLPESCHEMIGEYLYEILQHQPEGPYIIGGHCYGAYISYELVRLLEDMGKEVEALVILDVPTTVLVPIIKMMRLKRMWQTPGSMMLKHAIKTDRYYPWAKKEHIVTRQRAPEEQLELAERKDQIRANILQQISVNYSPSVVIRSPITVVSAREFIYERKSKEHWQRMTFGDVTWTEINGDHDSMFYPPNVAELHRALNFIQHDRPEKGAAAGVNGDSLPVPG